MINLRIESNINLNEEIKDARGNWRKIREGANKIVLFINNIAIAIIKDRECKSDYTYNCTYVFSAMLTTITKEKQTDKERIAQLEKEVAELKAESNFQKEKLYTIKDYSYMRDMCGERFHGLLYEAKQFPYYKIIKTGNFGWNDYHNKILNTMIENIETGNRYYCIKSISLKKIIR